MLPLPSCPHTRFPHQTIRHMKAGKEATALLSNKLFESDKALVLSATSWLADFLELQLSIHKTWLATKQAQAQGQQPAGVLLTGSRLLVDHLVRGVVRQAFQYLWKHYLNIRGDNRGENKERDVSCKTDVLA